MDNVVERQGWRETKSPDLMPSDLARRFWFDTVNEHTPHCAGVRDVWRGSPHARH